MLSEAFQALQMIAKGAFGTSIDLLLSKYLLKSIIKIMVVLSIYIRLNYNTGGYI